MSPSADSRGKRFPPAVEFWYVIKKKKQSHVDIDILHWPLRTGNECSPCCYLRSPPVLSPLTPPHPVISLAQSPCCIQLPLLNELRHLVLSSGAATWPSASGCWNPSFKSRQSGARALKRLLARLFPLSFIIIIVIFVDLRRASTHLEMGLFEEKSEVCGPKSCVINSPCVLVSFRTSHWEGHTSRGEGGGGGRQSL